MDDPPENQGQAQRPEEGSPPRDPARAAELDESVEVEGGLREPIVSEEKENIALPGGLTGPTEGKEKSIEEHREDARRRLAYILVGILGFTVAFSLFVFFLILMGAIGATVDDLVTVLNVLFAPVVALVGAATGFYFGANSQNQQGGR